MYNSSVNAGHIINNTPLSTSRSDISDHIKLETIGTGTVNQKVQAFSSRTSSPLNGNTGAGSSVLSAGTAVNQNQTSAAAASNPGAKPSLREAPTTNIQKNYPPKFISQLSNLSQVSPQAANDRLKPQAAKQQAMSAKGSGKPSIMQWVKKIFTFICQALGFGKATECSVKSSTSPVSVEIRNNYNSVIKELNKQAQDDANLKRN